MTFHYHTKRQSQTLPFFQTAIAVFILLTCLAPHLLAEKNNTPSPKSPPPNSAESKSSAAYQTGAAYQTSLASITAETLKEHVYYLADDRLQGRKPGTEGGRAAGEHIATEFKKYGLAPGDADAEADYFQPFTNKFRNVLAILPGSDPQLKDEVIVIGAHYDHLGAHRSGKVCNGADDNASGTAGLLELAEAFTLLPTPPRRTILFAAWDGEESGLLGSLHWVKHPSPTDANVVFALNMDMIGRLRDNKLSIHASRSGYGMRRLLSTINSDLTLEFKQNIRMCSDHWSFYCDNVPAIMFNTGRHQELHSPQDDAELINDTGMRRITQLVFETANKLANADEVPAFRETSHNERTEPSDHPVGQFSAKSRNRLGADWWINSNYDGGEVRLYNIRHDCPAWHASLVSGDCVISLAGKSIKTTADMEAAVLTAATSAEIVVRRDGTPEPLELSVKLPGKPMKLGVFWRSDEAEPGTVVVGHVVPGTPAAQAGLQSGDRIYRLNGKRFKDDAEFSKRIADHQGPLKMLVEHDGILRTVEVWAMEVARANNEGS